MKFAAFDGRQEVECAGGDENLQGKQSGRDAVERGELGPERAAAFRKDQGEMDEQRGLDEPGGRVAPVDDPVEGIQFAAVVEAVKNERNQTENIEMDGAGRVPAADENEQADEKIEQAR